MNKKKIVHVICWSGIEIEVSYCPQWSTAVHNLAHLEIKTIDGSALPITETGYRSHFLDIETIEAEGGAVAYALKWLDQEAKNKKWKDYLTQQNQLSLF